MGAYILAIDLGGTKIEVAIFDEAGRIIGRARGKTEGWRGDDEVFERIVNISRKAIADAGADPEGMSAIGIGSPGPLDPDTGVIIETANLKFKNFPLGQRLSEVFNRPTIVENDVNAGTYGEYKAGAAQGASDVLGVFIGTGIGGGIIIDGKLLHGFNKNAAEIGHMIIRAGGPRCGCGRRGCFEAVGSRTAISRDIKKAIKQGEKTLLTKKLGKDFESTPSSALKEAYEYGDVLVVKVMKRAAKYIGIGIGSLVNGLSPQIIVLGGGVIEAMGESYIEIIDRHVRKVAFATSMKDVKLVKAQLGDDAGITGVSMLAKEKFCGT